MQRRINVLPAVLTVACGVATADDVVWAKTPAVVTVSGQLGDSAVALSGLIDQLLRTLPLGANDRRRLLLRAAACAHPKPGPAPAPGSRPEGVRLPAIPHTTTVPAGEAQRGPDSPPSRASTSSQPDGPPQPGPTSGPTSQPGPKSDGSAARTPSQTNADSPAAAPEGAGAGAESGADGCAVSTSESIPAQPREEQVERWLRTLINEQLGYCILSVHSDQGRLELRLRRFRVVRRVSVRGNWPIFEEEFIRRLSFRPGQRVPEGPELTRTLQNQQDRLKRFLARRGYFAGKLAIKLTAPDEAGQVDVDVRIDKGRSYKVGRVLVERMGASPKLGDGGDAPQWEPAIPRDQIERLFRDTILFYRRGFNTARCKRHVQQLRQRYQRLGYPGVRIKDDCTKLPKQIDEQGVRITLRVQQRKQISVQYRGNDHLSAKQLDQSLTLAEAGAYDAYELAESAQRLHKKYQSEGFLQARIRSSRRTLPTRDVVTFHIHEGPRFRVERVEFSGNRATSDEELRTVVRTQPYPLWGLGEGGYVTDVQLQQDIKRIKDLYRARGFSRVRVQGEIAPDRRLLGRPGALSAAVATGATDKGRLFVRFIIDEGPRTVLERIEIKGAQLLQQRRLLAQIPLRAGEAFSKGLLAESLSQLKRLYFERGRPYAHIRVACAKVDASTRNIALLRLVVSEGEPVSVGPILLRGNPRTRASVIRSALGLVQGEPFDIRRLERGELTLRQLGVFNSVRIQVLGLQARLREVPVLVTVEERYDDHGAIELGVGGSTDNALFGAVGYNWSNAFGFAANLRVRGEFGPQIQSGNLDALYPRAFGSEYGLDLQLFVRNELTERLGPLLTYGGALTVSREILRDLRALLSYSLRRIETDEPVNRPAGDFDEAADAPVTTRTGALSASLIYDKRDNPLAPSRGFRLAGRLSWASEYLAGTADFLKLRLNGQAYIPLPLDITIAFGARYDHGIPLGTADLLPRVERFFAGGDTTIRGFEEDAAFAERIESPLGPLLDPTLVRLVPQGGNIRLLTNIELQFPIWKESILLGLPLMGAIFVDNGVVTNSFDSFDFAEFRHGLGAALRIVTLVGFLSVEYAVPLDPQVGDPRDGRFHVNFGFIF